MLFLRYTALLIALLFSHSVLAETALDPLAPAIAVAEISHDMSPLGMYLAAHPIVQTVIWVLLICSIITWVIFVSKSLQLLLATRSLRKEQDFLVQQRDFQHTRQSLSASHPTSQQFIHEIEDELRRSDFHCDDDLKQRIDYRLDRKIQSLSQNMRYGISPLATIGAVAPFIGLFGTVWGIMNSFIGIVHAQTASLSVVAPGIAEALFATALGLVAAIPAVILYNFFTRQLTNYSLRVSNLAAILRLMVKRDMSLQRLSHTALFAE